MTLDQSSLHFAAAVAALSLLNHSASAQPAPHTASQPPDATGAAPDLTPSKSLWRMDATLDYSAVAGSDVSFQGRKGDSDAQAVNANLNGEIPINDQWFVPLRLTSRNLFLGTAAGLPIPDEIHTLGFDAGLGYHLNDQWTFAASVGPRLYRFNNVGTDEVGVDGTIRATYQWKPNLIWMVGVNFEPDRTAPVLPAAGLRWDINSDWTLDLMWPRTALIRHVAKPLDVFMTGGGNFAVFRADSNIGNHIGQPAYNNALATYRDFHIGIGAEYRFVKGLSLELEGGYSAGREINYKDVGQTVSFDPSPYVQVGLRWRF